MCVCVCTLFMPGLRVGAVGCGVYGCSGDRVDALVSTPSL